MMEGDRDNNIGGKLSQEEGTVSAKGPRRKAPGGPRGHQRLVQREQERESWVMRLEKVGGARPGRAKTYRLYKLSGFIRTSGCSRHLASVMVWG